MFPLSLSKPATRAAWTRSRLAAAGGAPPPAGDSSAWLGAPALFPSADPESPLRDGKRGDEPDAPVRDGTASIICTGGTWAKRGSNLLIQQTIAMVVPPARPRGAEVTCRANEEVQRRGRQRNAARPHLYRGSPLSYALFRADDAQRMPALAEAWTDVLLQDARGCGLDQAEEMLRGSGVARERCLRSLVTQPRATAILQEDQLNSQGPSRADSDPAFPS